MESVSARRCTPASAVIGACSLFALLCCGCATSNAANCPPPEVRIVEVPVAREIPPELTTPLALPTSCYGSANAELEICSAQLEILLRRANRDRASLRHLDPPNE